MTDLTTIAQLQARLDNGEATATSLLEERQSRITCSGRLSPFRVLEWGRAFEHAARLDSARAQGAPTGPLSGIPMAHKDMFDRAGSTTGFGAHRTAARPSKLTATALQRLDEAGAIDFGRLEMSEFAMGPTGINFHHGMPENPTVPGAIPGGSSSGSGVAVAAGLVPSALGSDTGGSIRLPAACNGVVGFKPTMGRVPLDGAMPLSWTQDTVGPLAASVDCARRVLSALTQGATRIEQRETGPLRIGFDRGAFTDAISPAMRACLATLRETLEGQGHELTSVDLAFFSDLEEAANVIAISEGAAVHADRLRSHSDSYGPEVRTRLTQSVAMSAQAYLRARQIRAAGIERTRAEVFSTSDLVILPTLPDVPPQASAFKQAEGAELSGMISRLTKLTRPASILGLPALSLPVLWTEEGPLSVQVVGPHGDEDLIADLAQTLETARVPDGADLTEPA